MRASGQLRQGMSLWTNWSPISNGEWKGTFWMCLQTVRKEMRGWAGQGIHRYFPRLQAIWLIPMRFTENIYTTCIRNSFWRTEWFRRLSPHSDRQNVPAHGETPHVSFPGTYICSAGTKQYSKTRLRAWKRGSIIYGELTGTIMDGDRFSIMGTGLLLTVQAPPRTACMERLMKHILQTSTTRQVRRLLQKQQKCLDWKKRDRNIRKSQTVSGRSWKKNILLPPADVRWRRRQGLSLH